MLCIFCRHELDVTNSRQQARSNRVWRRRNCPDCSQTFTTLEAIDLSRSIEVTSSGGKQPFVRDILFLSIYRACQHRPAAVIDSGALTDTILARLQTTLRTTTVSPGELRDEVLRTLKRFDSAAASQYQAFHPAKRYR